MDFRDGDAARLLGATPHAGDENAHQLHGFRERIRARSGADKVAINTAAIERPHLLSEAAKMFGSQCIVSSIEAFRGSDGNYRCWVDYGREPTKVDAIDWAQRVVELGVGEILLTSINNEGMGSGYDLDLINRVSCRVTIPIIACGGAGRVGDFSKAIEAGADAVSAASVFHYHYAKPKPERKTMQDTRNRLRMGQDIDAGNIDFLNRGYGGEKAIMVEPASIAEAKEQMKTDGVRVREVGQ